MQLCVNCLKPANKRCGQCHVAWYCSAECQKKDWNIHKPECATKGKDYDASDACNKIVTCFMNERNVRDYFAKMTRSRSDAHGIHVRFRNAVEVRMALQKGCLSVAGQYLTKREQYADTPPVSMMGHRQGKDYILLVEVVVPNQNNGLCASLATPMPFDFDEPGQMHALHLE